MACSVTLTSYSLSECFSSKGGLKTIWLAPYVKDAFVIGSGDTVTGFKSGITWYKQEVWRNTTSLESTLNVDDNSGLNEVTTLLTIVYRKMDKENRMNANAIAKGDFIAVAEDANGEFYALGVEEPCRSSSGTGTTGTNREDSNRFELQIEDHNSKYPQHLDKAASDLLP